MTGTAGTAASRYDRGRASEEFATVHWYSSFACRAVSVPYSSKASAILMTAGAFFRTSRAARTRNLAIMSSHSCLLEIPNQSFAYRLASV